MDAKDRKLLAELVSDARLSNAELARRVELSPSACLALRRLERRGIIVLSRAFRSLPYPAPPALRSRHWSVEHVANT